MAPRKRALLEDGYSSDSASSSSSAVANDGDRRRRRRRRNGKERAMLGVFGDGSDEENEREGGVGRTVRAVDGKGRKVDYLRGQTFVKAENSMEMDMKDNIVGSAESSDDDDDDDDYSEAETFARIPPTEQEQLETRNPFADAPTAQGIEAQRQIDEDEGFQPASFTSMRGGIGSANRRGGIGSSSAASDGPLRGIGSISMFQSAKEATSAIAAEDKTDVAAATPTAFASSPFVMRARANVRDAPQQTPAISFKTGTGFGGKFDPAKYLAQMGWSGGGLGKQGEGIVNPIEVKQRPERAGIAFGGLKEKTKQAKDEARRRGEEVSTDEDERADRRNKERKSRGKDSRRKPVDQAWTKAAEKKPRKPKVEHRTYEQIVEEFGHQAPGVGMVVDASGKEFTSLSAALAQHAVPTADTSELIEIRHNLRLICETNTSALEILANEGAAIKDRRKWLDRDIAESTRRIQSFTIQEQRTQSILEVVQGLENLQKEDNELDAFVGQAQEIARRFPDAITEFNLDGALVGAMTATFKRVINGWAPLLDPAGVAPILDPMLPLLKTASRADVMTPYETLIWNVWMPPVRSALNNEWDVRHAEPATELFRVWSNVLPAFVRDNVSQQLIIPKLMAAVSDWNAKEALYTIVFPWMPLLGDQMDEVLGEAKRRMRSSLRLYKVTSGVPHEVRQWRDVFRKSEWNSMLLHHVVEKLSLHLDAHFTVDPEAQDVKALEDCLAWKPLMSDRMFNKLLAARVIPKLIKTLHIWLAHADGRLHDVAQWYEHWKAYFHQRSLANMQAVRVGLQALLKLMDDALELGDQRRHLLNMPDLKVVQHDAGHVADESSNEDRHGSKKAQNTKIASEMSVDSFRRLIEEAAAQRDLLVQPINKAEQRTGQPLFRLSRAIDGRNGKTFYVEDDVIFVEQRAALTYDPVSLAELLDSVA